VFEVVPHDLAKSTSQPDILRSPSHVHHHPWSKLIESFRCGPSTLGADRGDSVENVPEGEILPFHLLLQKIHYRRALGTLSREGALQQAQHTRLEKGVGVEDRSGIRRGDEQTRPGGEEEIEGVERRTRTEIEDDEVGGELIDLLEQGELPPVREVGSTAEQTVTGDEKQSLLRGRNDELLHRVHLPVDEMADSGVAIANAENGVEVASPEVEVDEDYRLLLLRQSDAQIGRQERLADAALSACDRYEVLHGYPLS
jgi:hypothetical protein